MPQTLTFCIPIPQHCRCHHHPKCQQDDFDPGNCHILILAIEYAKWLEQQEEVKP